MSNEQPGAGMSVNREQSLLCLLIAHGSLLIAHRSLLDVIIHLPYLS